MHDRHMGGQPINHEIMIDRAAQPLDCAYHMMEHYIYIAIDLKFLKECIIRYLKHSLL
jgi:hypothetical protein